MLGAFVADASVVEGVDVVGVQLDTLRVVLHRLLVLLQFGITVPPVVVDA